MKNRFAVMAFAVLFLFINGCNINVEENAESQKPPSSGAVVQESGSPSAEISPAAAPYPEQAAEYLRQCLDGSALVFVNRAKDMGFKPFAGINYADARMSPNGNYILCKTDLNGAGEARWSGYSVIDLTTNPTETYAFDGVQWGYQDHIFLSDEIIGFASGGVIGGQEDTWEPVRLFDNQYAPLDAAFAVPEGGDTEIVGIGYNSGAKEYILAYAVNTAGGQEVPFSQNRLVLEVFGQDGTSRLKHEISEDYMSLYSPNLLTLIPNNPLITSDGQILIPVMKREDAGGYSRKLLAVNTDWHVQELPYGEALRLSANGDRALAINYDGQAVPTVALLDFKSGTETVATEIPDTGWEIEGYPNRFYPIDAAMRDHHVYIMAESYTENYELFCGLFYWDGEQAELLQMFPDRGFYSLAGVDGEGFCHVMLNGIYGDEYADQRDYVKALLA